MKWMALFALGACVLYTGCSPANIVICSVPPGAEIHINGNFAGITPQRFLFPVGEKQLVTLTMPGKLKQEGQVWIVPRRRYYHESFQSAHFHGSRFIASMRTQEEWDALKKAEEESEEQRVKRVASLKAEAFDRAFAASTFFGLTVAAPFTKKAKAKLGAPAKEGSFDENLISYYDSPTSFAPFHQMLVEHSPADGAIKSLRFYGFYDSDEKAENYLIALRATLSKDYRFRNHRNWFFVQNEPNERVFRIILTAFKTKKDQTSVVVRNNRLNLYALAVPDGKTLLVLDVLGTSYKLDKGVIKRVEDGLRGELKPIDPKPKSPNAKATK